MSAISNMMNIIAMSDAVETVIEDKKTTLLAKNTKLMVFGYWFIDRLAIATTVDESTAGAMREQLNLFASPEVQNAMFESFFEGLKDSTKSMKSLIKARNAKPKKVKDVVVKEKTEKKKNNKKSTETVFDPQDALVAEIVAAAQTIIEPGADNNAIVRKGANKEAKALEVETKKANKLAEEQAKKEAKTATNKPVPLEPELIPEPDDEQDVLNLRPISFPDGKSFLLDESNNLLYSNDCIDLDVYSHSAIFDPTNKSYSFV